MCRKEMPSSAAVKIYLRRDQRTGQQGRHGLKTLGIEPGDKVALSCPNLPYFPIIYYGILKAGAAVVPLNVLFKPREIAYHLNDSDAKAYFASKARRTFRWANTVSKAFKMRKMRAFYLDRRERRGEIAV